MDGWHTEPWLRLAILMRRKLLVVLTVLLMLLAAGVAAAFILLRPERPQGSLDTELEGVSLFQDTDTVAERPETTTAEEEPEEAESAPERCWPNFGGDNRRSLSRPNIRLGLPAKRLWRVYTGKVLEYPPSFCDGVVYANFSRITVAVDAETGKEIWRRDQPGPTASSPAVDGPRLLVSSHAGTVTAHRRTDGKVLWRLKVPGKVESSPIVVDGVAFFGTTEGRLFAVWSKSGRVKWAYNARARINSSPVVLGNRVCISTYAGSIFCVRRDSGRELFTTFVSRNALQMESFYATPSSDGRRLFTISRAGRAVAVSAFTGKILWTRQVTNQLAYSTPVVAKGMVFVSAFDGGVRALRASDGRLLWERFVPGRILAGGLLVGNLLFVSTLEKKTYALLRENGRVVWRLARGKYNPGIATDRRYYLSVHGSLIAYTGRAGPR